MGNQPTRVSDEREFDRLALLVQEQHVQIDEQVLNIQDQANTVIQQLESQGYLNSDQLCSQIGVQKAQELKDFFPLQVLDGVRYRLGFSADSEQGQDIEERKEQACADIVTFYQRKRRALQQIVSEAPKCKMLEREAWTSIQEMVNTADTTSQIAIYSLVDQYNAEIKTQYNRIQDALNKIRKAETVAELDSAIQNSTAVLSEANSQCRSYQNKFLAYRPIVSRPPIVAPPPAPIVVPAQPIIQPQVQPTFVPLPEPGPRPVQPPTIIQLRPPQLEPVARPQFSFPQPLQPAFPLPQPLAPPTQFPLPQQQSIQPAPVFPLPQPLAAPTQFPLPQQQSIQPAPVFPLPQQQLLVQPTQLVLPQQQSIQSGPVFPLPQQPLQPQFTVPQQVLQTQVVQPLPQQRVLQTQVVQPLPQQQPIVQPQFALPQQQILRTAIVQPLPQLQLQQQLAVPQQQVLRTTIMQPLPQQQIFQPFQLQLPQQPVMPQLLQLRAPIATTVTAQATTRPLEPQIRRQARVVENYQPEIELSRGETVEVLQVKGNLVQIRKANGQVGYVPLSYLQRL